jgi:hypothetical protein
MQSSKLQTYLNGRGVLMDTGAAADDVEALLPLSTLVAEAAAAGAAAPLPPPPPLGALLLTSPGGRAAARSNPLLVALQYTTLFTALWLRERHFAPPNGVRW